MNIVYDYQNLSNPRHSGISRYFVELAARINRFAGCRAQIVSPIARSPILAEHRNLVDAVGFDLSGFTMLPDRVAWLVNEVLFRGYTAILRPDIVHETDYGPRRTAPRLSKIVTTVHDTIPERLPHLFRDFDKAHARKQTAIARADHVICVSESTRRDLMEFYDVDPARVTVTLLGSSLNPVEDKPVDIGMPYFLHVGSRFIHKNFGALVQAFADAGLHRTHCLVNFSSIPFGRDEFQAIERLGLPRKRLIRVEGDDRQLALFYSGAEALVYPSLYEGFGIPVLEAMRCCCPVITSNVSSMPEISGDAAIYVDPNDVGSIATAMMRVASSPETRIQMIGKGMERERCFSWDRCAAQTHAIYKDVLSKG